MMYKCINQTVAHNLGNMLKVVRIDSSDEIQSNPEIEAILLLVLSENSSESDLNIVLIFILFGLYRKTCMKVLAGR